MTDKQNDLLDEIAELVKGADPHSECCEDEYRDIANDIAAHLEKRGWQPPGCAVSSTPSGPASREHLLDACDVACTYLEDSGKKAHAMAAIELRDAVRAALARQPALASRDLAAAAKALHDDLVMRARFARETDQDPTIVDASDGVWDRFCTALANTPDGWREITDEVKDGRFLLVTRIPYTGRQPFKVAWWGRNASKRPAWVWRSREALRFEPTHYFDPTTIPQPPEMKE